MPMFEEVFYLAAQHERLSTVTKLYAPPFRTLAQVHDKGTFQELCDRLEIRTPHTILAHSPRSCGRPWSRYPRVLRPRRLLARRRRPVHQHRAARRPSGVRRLPADRGESLVGPGVRRRADALHLLLPSDGERRHPHVLPRAPPVGALDRDPVPLGRSLRHPAQRGEARQRTSPGTGRCRSTSSRPTTAW